MNQPCHLTIITGASRGLGRAIASVLLEHPHQHVIGISRRSDAALSEKPGASDSQLEQWAQDLSDPAPAAARLRDWLLAQDPPRFASATIINNAGVMAPPRPLGNAVFDDIAQCLRVGLEAPMLLTSAFLRGTNGWAAERKILNVSSGLGSMARGGQAPYCAVKAGLDHFTRVLALEAAAQTGGARAVSLYPGIVDTDMQADLRSANPAEFPDVSRFLALKDQGLLSSPEDTARKVIACLGREDFGVQTIVDLAAP